jgi:HlyD family secretion protein
VIGSDPRRLRLEVEVDERYLSAVLPGPVSFVVPAYGSYAFSGTIRQLDLSRFAVRSPASYVVAIDVANADGALQPGMSAVVELAMAAGRDTLSVPTRALVAREDASEVWLPGERGVPVLVPVTVGVTNAELTEARGAGIAAGRAVVVDASPSTCRVPGS